jgi:hypothetical protein
LTVPGNIIVTSGIEGSGASPAPSLSGFSSVNAITFGATGQIVSTASGNSSDGGGQIYLNGATNNRIDWNTNGTGAPAFTTRSAGSKIVLYPLTNGTNTDYAIGINSGTFWSSVPQNDAALQFKWYGGVTEIGSLSGTGVFSVAGNVTGAYIKGNGSELTNLPVPTVSQDIVSTGDMSIMLYDGNIKYNNYATVEPATGTIKSSGNISVAGNVQAGNVRTTGIISATGNITSGNVLTGGLISATGNVTSGNVLTAGLISATSTITSAANITGGNILTGGLISATGNVSGNFFVGNGRAITGILFSNTSDATTASLTVDDFYLSASTALLVTNSGASAYLFDQYPGNNPTIYAVAGSTLAFRLAVTGHPFLIQSSGANYSTGLNHVTTAGTVTTDSSAQGQIAGTLYWKIPGNAVGTYTYQCSVHAGMVGNIVVSSPTVGSFTTISATGNVTSGNVLTAGLISATSTITSAANITGGNILTGGLISATGNVSGGNLNVTGNIVDSGALTIITGSNGNIALTPNGTGIVTVSSNLSSTGNVTAQNFIGNISITGNVQGTSANVTLVAGAYSWTFDNTGNTQGNLSLTGGNIIINNAPGGNEGAEIKWALPSAANTVLNTSLIQDVFQNGMRFFESGGNSRGLYMDLGNVPSGAGTAVGYRDIPQVPFTANTTIAATDAGRHYYSTLSTGNVLTIANNASQSFQVGAAVSIINQGTGNITVAQGSGVTLYLAGNATSGNRTVATFGMATLIKVATDTWFINGTGVS